jgi:DNA adenine methylase
MTEIKPFLKWAGGKHRLVHVLQKYLPLQIYGYDTYIEPFVGAGAMVIHLLNSGFRFKRIIINDLNSDLMNTYRIIQQQPHELLKHLERIKLKYNGYFTPEDKKNCYLEQRDSFNAGSNSLAGHSALFIFLNKAGFNGLFRVNAQNKFNVPFGEGKELSFFNTDNILAVHRLLQRIKIVSEDFAGISRFTYGKTFIYLDPPYCPAGNLK